MSEKIDKNELLQKFLQVNNQDNYKEIVNDLMDAKHNLALKTHIKKPNELAILRLSASFMKEHGFTYPANIIKKLIRIYLKYMISKDRLGRKEVFQAITFNPEQSILINDTKDRLKQNLKK